MSVRAGVLLVALAAPDVLLAAEPMTGRWAADPSQCEPWAQTALVVTNEALHWSGDICRVGRSYRTGDTLHVEAFCTDGRPIPVTLRLHGDRIDVAWNRVPRGELRRCPAERRAQ